MVKNTINKILMAIGIFLMFGVLLIPNFIDTVGDLMGSILNPLINFFPVHIIIFILAAITGLYATIIQKYTMDWTLMRRFQERMKNMQQEFKQAQISNNPQKLKKLEDQRAEMMGDQMEMMKQQFKPMLYISIISIPLFFWAYSVVLPASFFWEDVSADEGHDNSKLLHFIQKTQGAMWAKNAKVEKPSDDVIIVSDNINSYTLTLNSDKTGAVLKNSTYSHEFKSNIENEKNKIHALSVTMKFPFWGEKNMDASFFGPFAYWLFWYFLCSILISQITRKALNIHGV